MVLDEYKEQVAIYLREKLNYSEQNIIDSFEMYEPVFQENFEKGSSVVLMATLIDFEF